MKEDVSPNAFFHSKMTQERCQHFKRGKQKGQARSHTPVDLKANESLFSGLAVKRLRNFCQLFVRQGPCELEIFPIVRPT